MAIRAAASCKFCDKRQRCSSCAQWAVKGDVFGMADLHRLGPNLLGSGENPICVLVLRRQQLHSRSIWPWLSPWLLLKLVSQKFLSCASQVLTVRQLATVPGNMEELATLPSHLQLPFVAGYVP